MAELKTKVNDKNVESFLNSIDDEVVRKDCFLLIELMQKCSNDIPKMWGESIVGFGSYHYKYASGKEADWFQIGFSPRKGKIAIYLISGFDKLMEEINKLGKHKTSKGCLYIKKLSDINLEVLEVLFEQSIKSLYF